MLAWAIAPCVRVVHAVNDPLLARCLVAAADAKVGNPKFGLDVDAVLEEGDVVDAACLKLRGLVGVTSYPQSTEPLGRIAGRVEDGDSSVGLAAAGVALLVRERLPADGHDVKL
eukprot:6030445-Prymnesium_polylepis.1